MARRENRAWAQWPTSEAPRTGHRRLGCIIRASPGRQRPSLIATLKADSLAPPRDRFGLRPSPDGRAQRSNEFVLRDTLTKRSLFFVREEAVAPPARTPEGTHANMRSCRSREATTAGSSRPSSAVTSRSSRRAPLSFRPLTFRRRSTSGSSPWSASRTTPSGPRCGGSGAGPLESREATLEGLLEATVALSALAREPERWEAVLRRLGS